MVKVFSRLKQWLWWEQRILVYRMESRDWEYLPRNSLRRELLDVSRLLQLEFFKAVAFPEAVQATLASGARCHGFFAGNELANIAWTRSAELDLGYGFSVRSENSIAIYDCHTLPVFRGRGIYPDTLYYLAREAFDEQTRFVFIAVDPGNAPSIRGIERAGFHFFADVHCIRRFGRRSIQGWPR
jgi:hypothetical protein